MNVSRGFRDSMPEDLQKRWAIEGMFATVQHIRDCERCRRVYGAAYDVVRLENAPTYVTNPWMVYFQCSRELHECEHWPKGI